jgi:hypothetical protein
MTINLFIAGLKIGNLNTYFKFTALQTMGFHIPILFPSQSLYVINTNIKHTARTYRWKQSTCALRVRKSDIKILEIIILQLLYTKQDLIRSKTYVILWYGSVNNLYRPATQINKTSDVRVTARSVMFIFHQLS